MPIFFRKRFFATETVQIEGWKPVFSRSVACFCKFLLTKLQKKRQNHYFCTVLEAKFKFYLLLLSLFGFARQDKGQEIIYKKKRYGQY